ncbi:MAG: polymerase subunit tau [Planctomycetota bacterium]
MAKKSAATPSVPAAADGAPADKPYTVLARRYRSRDFGEVVGQEPIARTLQNAIATNRTAHAYLFCGTRGVGKTSMARIFARALNRNEALAEGDAIGEAILRGEDLDVIEIDGASNRGIDDARDLIAGAGLAPTRGQFRIYIIDEVHMLTTPAFNALLKTMEEPPKHVKFILCTTEAHKVPQTIQSRCQRFDFRNIPTKEIARHLGEVSRSEGIEVTEDVLLSVARLANGSMRDGLSLLDRLLAAADGRVDAAVLEAVFGLPDDEILLEIVAAAVDERPGDALRHGARLLERGSGVEQALELLAERFRWILVASAAGPGSDLLEVAESMRAQVEAIAARTDPAFAAHAIALCDAAGRNARSSSAPRALYDAAVARLALSGRFASAAALLAGGGAPAGASSKKAGDPGARAGLGASGPAIEPKPVAVAPRPSLPPASPSPSPSPSSSPSPATPPAPAPTIATRAPEAPPAVATLDDLRARLADLAARSPRDQATLDSIEIVEFTGAAARVAVSVDAGSGRYLVTNPDPIRTLLSKAAGRPLKITVERKGGDETRVAPAPAALDDPEIRNDPLIRRAAELLGATIVAVTPRLDDGDAGDASAPTGDDAGAAGDDGAAAGDVSGADGGGFGGPIFEGGDLYDPDGDA